MDRTELARRAVELEQTLKRKRAELEAGYPAAKAWTALQMDALEGRVAEVRSQLEAVQADTA